MSSLIVFILGLIGVNVVFGMGLCGKFRKEGEGTEGGDVKGLLDLEGGVGETTCFLDLLLVVDVWVRMPSFSAFWPVAISAI